MCTPRTAKSASVSMIKQKKRKKNLKNYVAEIYIFCSFSLSSKAFLVYYHICVDQYIEIYNDISNVLDFTVYINLCACHKHQVILSYICVLFTDNIKQWTKIDMLEVFEIN